MRLILLVPNDEDLRRSETIGCIYSKRQRGSSIISLFSIGVIVGTPAAVASKQSLAPGQEDCNPGKSDFEFCGPPGERGT